MESATLPRPGRRSDASYGISYAPSRTSLKLATPTLLRSSYRGSWHLHERLKTQIRPFVAIDCM